MSKRFTLIELLMVIAIIIILASLLMPSLSRAKKAAKEVVCLNNMKQINLWSTMYSINAKRRVVFGNSFIPNSNLTWDDLFGGLYDSRNLDLNANKAAGVNPYTVSTPVRSSINFVYRCPLDMRRNGDWIARSYAINGELAGAGWVKGMNAEGALPNTSLDSVKNPNSTILFAERIVTDLYSIAGNADAIPVVGNDEQSVFSNGNRPGISTSICGSSLSVNQWTSNHLRPGSLPWSFADGHCEMKNRAYYTSFLAE